MLPINIIKRKSLLVIPVVLLILNAIYCAGVSGMIQNTLLDEKRNEMIQLVDVLSAAAGVDTDYYWYQHIEDIQTTVEYIDKLYQVYASMYLVTGDEFTLQTTRHFEEYEQFEPLDYKEFLSAISGNDKGEITLGFKAEGFPYTEVHVYYKWLRPNPETNLDYEYLIITGVHHPSVVTNIPLLVSLGQWTCITVSALLMIWLILLHISLGHVYLTRTPTEEHGRWRSRDESLT